MDYYREIPGAGDAGEILVQLRCAVEPRPISRTGSTAGAPIRLRPP